MTTEKLIAIYEAQFNRAIAEAEQRGEDHVVLALMQLKLDCKRGIFDASVGNQTATYMPEIEFLPPWKAAERRFIRLSHPPADIIEISKRTPGEIEPGFTDVYVNGSWVGRYEDRFAAEIKPDLLAGHWSRWFEG